MPNEAEGSGSSDAAQERGSSDSADETGPPDDDTPTEAFGPAYCTKVEPPADIRRGRARPGNSSFDIDLGRWDATELPPMACGGDFPECHRQFDIIVPFPPVKPGEYEEFDTSHRLHFAPTTCGHPSPERSERVAGTTMVIYEITDDCIAGSFGDPRVGHAEFIAEICRADD